MPNVEKLLQKMKDQPNGIKPDEADKVLVAHGYRFDRQKGSHKIYINAEGKIFTVAQKNPLKSYIVKQIVELISE